MMIANDDGAGDEGEIQAEIVDLDKVNYGDSFKGTIKLEVRNLLMTTPLCHQIINF